MQFCSSTFLSYRKNVSPLRVSAGRGCRRDPLGGARDCTLRRNGRGISVTCEPMVLEDPQMNPDSIRFGASAWSSSPFTSGKLSSPFPIHAPATVRSSVIDIASSLTAGLSWYPADSLGKYRKRTMGRLRRDSAFSTGLCKETQASARRWPCAERLAPNRLPDATGAAAGLEAAKERV